MSKKVSSFTFKDTFWSKKRVEADITIVELAKLFGISRSSMGAYLTGYLMPKDNIIKEMCEFFSVDPIEGKGEFEKAHKAWDAERQKTLKASAKIPYQKKTVVSADVDSHKFGEELLKMLYGKISYETYEVVSDYVFNDSGDPLAVIYGVVDYQTFIAAQKLVESNLRSFVAIEPDDSKWRI